MYLEPWERWKAAWQHAFFAVAIGLGTLGAVIGDDASAGLAVRLGLVAALAGWYGYWFGWATHRRRPAGAVHLPYLIGAAVLWAVMAAVDPALLAVGVAALMPYCMRRAMWSAAAVVVALSAVWLGEDLLDGSLNWAAVLTCLLGVGTVLVVAGYIATLDREGRARQRLLDQLAAAQAELAAAERAAGTLAERQRLARDIHDTLTQGFASIGMLLDAAQAHLPASHPAGGHVERALAVARENLAESRRLVWALRPVPLDGTGLADAVRSLTDRLAAETGVRAAAVATGNAEALPAAVEAGLLRVVQEARTNVRRHAAATEVTVTLSYMDDTVVVDVQDDGAGFAADLPPVGIGLRAMRERVAELGGTLTVESTPGEGTTVAAAIPRTGRSLSAGEPAGADPAGADPANGHAAATDAIPVNPAATDPDRAGLGVRR